MKSSSGVHYVALDHVRALAVLLVFAWHFVHGPNGFPVPFEGAPALVPLALFDEGHVGVALFMTLSGYLFAKLLDGKRIAFQWFFWNRVLRLFPLLIFVMLVRAAETAISAGDIQAGLSYLSRMPRGFVDPVVWPNGGWSIGVELHFYLVLPLLIVLARRSPFWLLAVIGAGLSYRAEYFASYGHVQDEAYWTIYGRIDQFTLGILAYLVRGSIIGRNGLMLAASICFFTIYWWFDRQGGFYLMPSYPSSSWIWVVLPTLEGLFFGLLIAWYDGSFVHRPGVVSTFVAKVGEYSYSIYLLHFFFVFAAAHWIHKNIVDLSNFYVALLVSFVAFLGMIPLGYLSMRFIEMPFLRLRRPYASPLAGASIGCRRDARAVASEERQSSERAG